MWGDHDMRMYDIIDKKKYGQKLSKEEIRYVVDAYTKGDIADYQMSAFLMAVWCRNMDAEETLELTMAMAESGDMLDLSMIAGTKLDKHSTGGVGDKTTLSVGPIIASLGIPMAKMSGRGLGHTGGTIDKLESIPGFSSDLSDERFIEIVKTVGFSDAAQTKNLAPADKKIYALRDVTATVDNYALIASSIMSKKIASGADAILLDVKCGSGAFMQDKESARKLAECMIEIGKLANRKVRAIISDMNEPLGNTVGNAIEVKEAIDLLKYGFDYPDPTVVDKRYSRLVLIICREMVLMSDIFNDEASVYKNLAEEEKIKEAERMVREAVDSKKAYKKLKEFIISQGGNDAVCEDYSLLPKAKFSKEVKLPYEGILVSCDTKEVGMASLILGAGRLKIEDDINYAAGIKLFYHLGDKVKREDTFAIIYTDDKDSLEAAEERLINAYKLMDEAEYKVEKNADNMTGNMAFDENANKDKTSADVVLEIVSS